MAGERYRRTDCQVVTEGGAQLGELSWRDLRFDLVSGEVQLALKVEDSSFSSYLIDLLFDVVSVFQPVDAWSLNAWHIELFLPLTTVFKANRNLAIVKAQAEADCWEQRQALVNQQQERLKASRERFRLTLARFWRRATGRTGRRPAITPVFQPAETRREGPTPLTLGALAALDQAIAALARRRFKSANAGNPSERSSRVLTPSGTLLGAVVMSSVQPSSLFSKTGSESTRFRSQ